MEPLKVDLLLRIADVLYDRETVQRFFQLLVEQGFRVIAPEEDIIYQRAVPEITSLAQQQIEVYLTQRQTALEMATYFLRGLKIEILIWLKPEQGVISFLVEQEDFYGSEEGRAAYMRLLDLFKNLYTFLHPFYGYEVFSADAVEGVRPDRSALLATHEIHHLYNINFLGPEIVAKFGRERLLNAPAWRKELLADGGILLIPLDLTGSVVPFGFKRVAVNLGLQTPQAPGEMWEEDKYTDPSLW